MGEDKTDKPKLRSIPGQRIDPEDVDDTPEELEALAIRLADDIRTIDDEYDLFRRADTAILALRNGMDIIQEMAETEGVLGVAELVDVSIRSYIRRVDSASPAADFASLAKDMAQSLLTVKEAIFSSHQLELGQKFPSAAWSVDGVRDAIFEGLADTTAIISALCPRQPGEDAKEYKKRMESFLSEAAAELQRRAESPPP